MALFMISDRNVQSRGLGGRKANLSYWASTGGNPERLSSWRKMGRSEFRSALIRVADKFPVHDALNHEKQKHVTLFIHGYNNDWQDAVKRYARLDRDLFQGRNGLGACVLFTWPSDGMVTNYLPDRADARKCAPDLAEVLCDLYDWMAKKQVDGARNPDKACRAKTSIIAHSMGNYLLQNAMQLAWTRKNQPLLVSLVNQLLMIGADVDNDIFDGGEAGDGSEGDAIANLTYRVTALYTGKDTVLGMSAGFKHFGKRRLGRSGLASDDLSDNVWDVDCTSLFPRNASDYHSGYFTAPKILRLIKHLLQGFDRGVLQNARIAPR